MMYLFIFILITRIKLTVTNLDELTCTLLLSLTLHICSVGTHSAIGGYN